MAAPPIRFHAPDLFFDNPVVVRDLRSRMRGSRTYWLLFGYLSFLAVAVYFAYRQWWMMHEMNFGRSTGTASQAGTLIFDVIFTIQAVLISLITPALTSGAISVERQQRTFDLLRATTLPSRSIVVGKLISSLSFVALLMVASIPIVALSFMLGGVSPSQIIATFAMLLCDAALFGAMGLMWSSCCNTTAAATGLTYLSVVTYFFTTLTWAGIAAFGGGAGSPAVSALNPVGALTAGSAAELYYGFVQAPAWLVGLLINGGLTFVLLLVSINRIEDRPGRRSMWLRVAALVVTAVALYFFDGASAPVMSVMTVADRNLWVAYCALIAVALLIPPFATGLPDEDDADDRPRSFIGGWSPMAAFRRVTVESGAPMSLAGGVVVAAVSVIALWLVTGGASAPVRRVIGRRAAAMILHGSGSSGAAVVSFPAWWHAMRTFGRLDRPLGVAFGCIALALAMGAVGRLCSYLCRSRWVAAAWVYVLFICAAVMPYLSYDIGSGGVLTGPPHEPLMNSLYLSPIAVWQLLCYEPGAGFTPIPFNRLVFAPAIPPWVVLSLLYLAIAAAVYAIAEKVGKRRFADEQIDPLATR